MLPIHTILHATDFSAPSRAAFHVACALARDYNASLLILYTHEATPMVFGEFGALPPTDENETEMRQRLAELMPTDASIPVERFFAKGVPAEEILELARVRNADVIVMGSHGRTGFERVLMGSVAERVVRKADCLVLTVKKPVEMPVEMEAAGAVPAAV